MLPILGLFLTFINLYAYVLMGRDKKRAKNAQWRVPESTLFWVAFCGGAAGVWLGMKKFRHKTQHGSFRLGIPGLLLVNLFGIGYVLGRFLLN